MIKRSRTHANNKPPFAHVSRLRGGAVELTRSHWVYFSVSCSWRREELSSERVRGCRATFANAPTPPARRGVGRASVQLYGEPDQRRRQADPARADGTSWHPPDSRGYVVWRDFSEDLTQRLFWAWTKLSSISEKPSLSQ
jgi:hypothetical protein